MPRPRTETPTFSLTLRNGRFYVAWWEDGAARRVSCRTANAPAARRFLAEFRAGRNAPIIPDAPTVGAVLDAYAADRMQRPIVSALPTYIALLKGVLGDLPVDLLNRERVHHYAQVRKANGCLGAVHAGRDKKRPLSDATIRKNLLTLRAALNWAKREGWIANVPYFELPPPGDPRQRWLTRDEAERLLAAATRTHMRLFILLGLYTAARASAILDLTWDRVDFDRERIDFGTARFANKKRAVVPMHSRLREPLLRAQSQASSPWVLEWGGKKISSIASGFGILAERANIPDITPHVLRHTSATWMAQSGVSVNHIAAFLGNSPAVVARVYIHNSPDYLTDALRGL